MRLERDSSGPLFRQIQNVAKLYLFLDYDGTLASFAPTPDDVLPDPELIALLEKLKNHPQIHIAVISGRRLSHVQALVPIPGIILAGTYGIELLTADGTKIDRVEYETIRPALDDLKPRFVELIGTRRGFYLEDKGWSLALHAKNANRSTADRTINQAHKLIRQAAKPTHLFRVLGGHKFLEVAPRLAHKGLTVKHLLSKYSLDGALPIYLGDDDKDEEAFEVIQKKGGIGIKVDPQIKKTIAKFRLDSPYDARQLLASLL
jgi:trehalose-phosphatase